MRTIGMVLVGTLAVLFTIGAIAIIGADLSGAGPMPIAGILIDCLIPAALWYWFFKIRGGAGGGFSLPNFGSKKRIQSMSEEATQWIEKAKTGSIPQPAVGSVMVPPSERAILGCDAAFSELSASGTRHYMGTRVKIGSFPIYMGQSQSNRKKVFREADKGNFVVTNKSAYFVGFHKTLAVKLSDVLAIHPTLDSLVINIKNRAAPVAITTPNPILWTTVIQSLSNGTLSVP